MRWSAAACLALLLPAAARGEEGKPRPDPKDLEIEVLHLKDAVASFRERACRKIGAWGPAARTAIPSLAPLVEDPEAEVRRAAVFALGRMGREAAAEADHVVGALRDGDPGTRANAALALESLGGGRTGRAALGKALKDPDRDVRANAAAALGGLGADDGASLAALGAALRDEDVAVRANAARALGVPREKSRPFVAALARLLSDGSPAVRAMAARALGRIAEDDRLAVPPLLKALRSEIEIASAPKGEPEAAPAPGAVEDAVLGKRLEEHGGPRRNMAWALGRYGEGSREAKALLQRMQESDPNRSARGAAKTALERLDSTVLPSALEEEAKELPAGVGLPWTAAVAGGCLEVVFRFEK